MPAWVEEVDRLAEVVIDRAGDIDTIFRQASFPFMEGCFVCNFQREVLHPVRCIGVAFRRWSVRKLEEGEIAAIAKLEKDVGCVD